MNRENTEMEAEKLLDNMDLSLDDEEQQSDEDTTLTHPEIDAWIMLNYTTSVLLMKLNASNNYAIHPKGFFKRIYPKDGNPYWKQIHNYFCYSILKAFHC
jgi:hypothetical protein